MTTHKLPTPSSKFYQVRDDLLILHKELITFERQRYESLYGRIEGSGDFLGIVMQHPAFTWLRRFSELIVAYDEYMQDKPTLKIMSEDQIFAYTKKLIIPNETGDEFEQKYFVAIQNAPHIALLHSKLKQALA